MGLDLTAESETNCYAHYEKEKGENKIGGGPAMPLSMFKRPIDMLPGAGVVYKHHPGDRDSAKHIQGF
jgi:hypothetical protein